MIGIITYGSLINPIEIDKIAPDALYIPVKVNGYRRSFSQKARYRKGKNNEKGVLTIDKHNKSWFNGLLLYSLSDEYIESYKNLHMK